MGLDETVASGHAQTGEDASCSTGSLAVSQRSSREGGEALPPHRHIVDLLRIWAGEPHRVAVSFLPDGQNEESELTYGELDRRARAVAAALQEVAAREEPVLLLYPSGLDYVVAFFGCLYAGVLPVPAYPVRANRSAVRLAALVNDTGARFSLSTRAARAQMEPSFAHAPGLSRLRWLLTDEVEDERAESWNEPAIGGHSLALLQYTSGSTSSPRGVLLTHANLLHNSELIYRSFDHDRDKNGVIWLPPYHDMGLIGGIIQTVYGGGFVAIMPPVAFLQNPVCWLQAISRYRASTSGGPNFAYDLCLRRITPEEREQLDLSCWHVAFNGAETVRRETLEQFAEMFAPCGFRRTAFYPTYGLAEGTLLVSGGKASKPPVYVTVDRDALQQNRVEPPRGEDAARTIVGCGQARPDQKIVIADPDTLTRSPADRVGEIWVAGPSVAQGYWNRPDDTQQTFRAFLADTGEGPFLRTGDLGFFKDGELAVTGRLKDLIVIHGRNHYPQDIELTVEASHPGFRHGCGAAFSVDVAGEERLVVVQEVERQWRHLDGEEAVGVVRSAVAEQHELHVHTVVLLKPLGLPKTSSGKTQRSACRAALLEGTLPTLFSSVLGPSTDKPVRPAVKPNGAAGDGEQPCSLIEQDLTHYIAEQLGLPTGQLDPARPLNYLGLDSLTAVGLKSHIEQHYGVLVPMERFVLGISLAELARYVVAEMNDGPRPAADEPKPCLGTSLNGHAASPDDAPARRPAGVAGHSIESNGHAGLTRAAQMDFSLLYFSANEAEFTQDKYQLYLEGAKFADRHGFTAIWTPERHFHAFGGLYPNPSVLAAALAMVTERIRIRAGSVVLPLHNPVRVAEEWAVVDNLSHGRVDLAFATGWNPNDFVLAPQNYAERRDVTFAAIETIKKLWRGETISLANGAGNPTAVRIYPLPQQQELSVWITCSGGPERFAEAGAAGANVLTALLFQTVEELAEKIAMYRKARAEHGHDPAAGKVTLMLHTYLDHDLNAVRSRVREPFTHYLSTSADLWRNGANKLVDLDEKSHRDLLDFAFERYFQTAALFGTPETCRKMVDRLKQIGVGEIACLIDFGVDVPAAMKGLAALDELRQHYLAPRLPQAGTNGDARANGEGHGESNGHAGISNRSTSNGSATHPPLTRRTEPTAAQHLDRDAHLKLAYKRVSHVLDRAREFDLADQLRATGLLPYFRELDRNESATCVFEGRQVIMLGSNNYLGLTADQRVREATARAAMEEGPSLTGSRLLNGSTTRQRELERKLAAFLGYEDCLLFTTGYQANLGLLSALMTEDSTLIVDNQCHASIFDGAFMSRCQILQFRHNDLAHLERRLQEVSGKSAAMVMLDGVYSMAGDIAPLPQIRELCVRYNACSTVDDAHGLGMLGASGKGAQEHFGMTELCDLVCGTFSKSLASIGGWVVGGAKPIDWIRFHGRSMLFSAAIPPTAVAAASTALEILIAEPWRLERLNQNAAYWREGLTQLGFNTGNSETPIVPILLNDDLLCMQFGKALLDAGLYVNSVVYPAVPRDSALLRTSVMATHERSHLDQALAILKEVAGSLGIA